MFVDVKYTTAFADYSGDLAKRDVLRELVLESLGGHSAFRNLQDPRESRRFSLAVLLQMTSHQI